MQGMEERTDNLKRTIKRQHDMIVQLAAQLQRSQYYQFVPGWAGDRITWLEGEVERLQKENDHLRKLLSNRPPKGKKKK